MNAKETLDHYRNNEEPVLDYKAEVAFALEQAIIQIEYMEKMLHRELASAPCVVVTLKNALEYLKEWK